MIIRKPESDNLAAIREWCDRAFGVRFCTYCQVPLGQRLFIECQDCSAILCAECFSIGAEIGPHTNDHSYCVRDAAAVDLFHTGWTFADEYSLLESMLDYGLGNWQKVSERVGRFSVEECRTHYAAVYFGHAHAPLPNVTLLLGPSQSKTVPCCPFHSDPEAVATLGEKYTRLTRLLGQDARYTCFVGSRLDFGYLAIPRPPLDGPPGVF